MDTNQSPEALGRPPPLSGVWVPDAAAVSKALAKVIIGLDSFSWVRGLWQTHTPGAPVKWQDNAVKTDLPSPQRLLETAH